jgi:hypothetical protein
MRIHIRPYTAVLTLCLSLAAAAALAGDWQAAPPVPPAPPAPAASATVSTPPDIDESTLRARVDEARRRADAARKREDALRAQMDEARRRLEVAAQQLAALSAQVNGPMMQRVEALAGPTRVLVGIQLDDSSGNAGARVREVSPGGPAEQAGVRAGDLIVAVNGTDVRGREPVARVVQRLRDVRPGDKVVLKVVRDGTTRDLVATARPDGDEFFVAREFPDMPAVPAMPAMPRVKAFAGWDGPMIIAGPMADMELARLTPGLGRYFGTDTGVLVVRAPSKGALGLQDGDVILSIDGRKPIDSSHVIRIFSSYDPGEKLTLDVLRLHRRISVVATVPAAPPMAQLGGAIRKYAPRGPAVAVTLSDSDRML